MSELIDYSNSFEHTLIAQGQGKYFISIERLNKPYKRNDGRLGKYLINFRSLSQECETERDEAWCCVEYSEDSFYQAKEIPTLLKAIRTGKSVNLFDHFI